MQRVLKVGRPAWAAFGVALLACVLGTVQPVEAAGSGSYTVQRGDSLWKIAKAHNVTVGEIVNANSISDPNLIHPGQVLIIPGIAPQPRTSSRTPPRGGDTYTVERGDTLGEIAERFDVPLDRLIAVNAISDPNAIDVGQVLAIPGRRSAQGQGNKPPRPRPTRRPRRPTEILRSERSIKVGGRMLGAEIKREAVIRASKEKASVEAETTLRLFVVKKTIRVFTIRRGVEAYNLLAAPRVEKKSQLELIGGNRISVGLAFVKSWHVTGFDIPVPIGPFVVGIDGGVGSTLELVGLVPVRWQGGKGLPIEMDGGIGLGGTIGVGVGVPGVRVGVDAIVDVVRGALYNHSTLTLLGVHHSVGFRVSSEVRGYLFAKVGYGFLSKKWRIVIPWLRFRLREKSIPIVGGHLEIG